MADRIGGKIRMRGWGSARRSTVYRKAVSSNGRYVELRGPTPLMPAIVFYRYTRIVPHRLPKRSPERSTALR